LEFYRQLQAGGQDIPAILVTGFSDEAKVIEAIRSGVRDFVPKTPDFLDYLPPAIERVMSQVRTKRQAAEAQAVLRINAQLQRLEEELRTSNERLLEADRRKDEFIAMLAHELRNPLAAIGNCVRLLTRASTENDRLWSQEVISRQTRHLGRLIDDLLDVSRITHGKIELHKQPVDLRALAERAMTTVRPLIEERGHALTMALAPGPLPLEADPTRVEQILVNLLNNAAKYTEHGGQITLTVRPVGTELVIEVKDSGVGLAPDMLSRIFDLFAQVENSLARSHGGLGIGLTLVKRLVELHGGRIEAQSDGLGKGSQFIVRLPKLETLVTERPAVVEKPSEALRAEADQRARVLVVEDNTDTAQGMSMVLSASGYDVRAVFDGKSAIEAARVLRPHFILLDIGLPGLDGYQVARAIRGEPGTKGSVVIAVSGYAQEQDRERSRDAGFDHHLIKPVDFDALFALLGGGSGSPQPVQGAASLR
jgi:signal transduction histidine kinase